jgi:hypothetical protein
MTLLRIAPAVIAAAGFAFFLSGPTAAAEEAATPPSQESSTQSTSEKADEKVCRKIEMAGSRVSRHKICKTRAEWDEIDGKSVESSGDKD